MPYAFAHPAAVVPVAKLLGARAVPSALAIGSMIPDAWYLLPFVGRGETHSVAGALLFCLPAGLAAYTAFHLVFKQPMLALAPRRLAQRLAAWAVPGLPEAPWAWVVLSLLAGTGTHLLWDAFTHAGHLSIVHERVFGVRLYRILQHASTLLGTLFVAGWVWRKLRARPPASEVRGVGERTRIAVLAAMVLIPAAAFAGVLCMLNAAPLGAALRSAGVMALSGFGLVALCFSLAWRASCARAGP